MDRAHRKELKHDKFVEQVGHTVEYAAEHKSQVLRWGGLALAALLVAAGVYWYMQGQAAQRQEQLTAAMRNVEAQIGPPNDFLVTFPTQADKEKAVEKSFSDLANRYPGKKEGTIARYFLGLHYADKGNLAEAEKHLKAADEGGDENYSSQAKLSLAQVYDAQNRPAEAEKLLRSLMGDPTVFVSKEQATIALARLKARNNPAEARKMLEPLRTERGAVSRAALTALGDIPK